MAVDCFLKIDGIPGESTDAQHKDEIDVLSWSWVETQSGSSATGGGTGKVLMQDFRFSTQVDKSSPKLMLACATGKHIKSAVLACRKAGGGQDFLTIILSDVIVSSYEIGGMSGAAGVSPTDQVSMHFAKIEFEYKQQKPDGSVGDTTKAGWDLKTNKPV
jgi:type VI secretion system secreted protein Hcp